MSKHNWPRICAYVHAACVCIFVLHILVGKLLLVALWWLHLLV